MARPPLRNDEVDSMRIRLAEAALEIYRREGLEAVSFRRIADVVGLSHTLPYRYFDNKEALLAEARRACFARFEAHVRAGERGDEEPLTLIRVMTTAYVSFVRRWPADYLLMFSTEQPAPDQFPALLAARRSLFEHAVALVQRAIDAGRLHGEARRITHLAWVSIHGLMTLHVANQLVHGYRLEQLIEPLIETIIGQHLPAAAPAKKPRAARAA